MFTCCCSAFFTFGRSTPNGSAVFASSSGEMFLYSGMAVRDHTQEVHVMGSDEIHIYHAAVVHDNNRETVSIGTDAAVISD